MKTKKKKVLLLIITVFALLSVLCNIKYCCEFLSYPLYNLPYNIAGIIVPLLVVIAIIKNKKKITFLSLGGFYFINSFTILSEILANISFYLSGDSGFIPIKMLVLLIASIITTISLCLCSTNKINSVATSVCCLISPVCNIYYILWSTLLYGFWGDFWLLLLRSFDIMAICVLFYYVTPREKFGSSYCFNRYFSYRNIAISIALSVITFGIYTIIWLVETVRNIHKLHGINKSTVGEVLLILFVPFYSWYWFYTRGKQMFEDSRKNGGNIPNNSVLYLVLAIFGLSLINLAVMQNCFNKYTVSVTVSQS